MKRSVPKRSRRDDPVQSRDFIKKAREIEADEKKSRADDVLGRLAKHRPEPHTPKKAAR